MSTQKPIVHPVKCRRIRRYANSSGYYLLLWV